MDGDDTLPLDELYVKEILSKPPFVELEGVINTRDLGYLPSSEPGKVTKPGYIFRAAELSAITPAGKDKLRALGVITVFDLRSDTEIAKYDSPLPQIDGVQVLHTPVFKSEDYSPEMMARRYALYASGETEAFLELYSQILDHAVPSFGAILRHIRDHPDKGCLFHCTAGKDRTGVIAAIILQLAGVDDATIAKDYALTRIGREPARKTIMARLSKEPLFASNMNAALKMFSSRAETMHAFLAFFEEKYGGAEGYLRKNIRFSDEDIETIRSNILISSDNLPLPA